MASIVRSQEQRPDSLTETRGEIARLLEARAPWIGEQPTAVAGLSLFRYDSVPQVTLGAIYDPSLSIIINGEKTVYSGGEKFIYDPRHYLLTAAQRPVITKWKPNSFTSPYYALFLRLDISSLRSLLAKMTVMPAPQPALRSSMSVGEVHEELLDPMLRMLRLADNPHDAAVLGPLIHQEIIFRLLQEPAGCLLRQSAVTEGSCHRIERVATWLRENYSQPLRVPELARAFNLGISTLHHQFRAYTGQSPVQYQKEVRLHAARKILVEEGVDVASAALRVGYESPTQFSREYRRYFGSPPLRDVANIRNDPVFPRLILGAPPVGRRQLADK